MREYRRILRESSEFHEKSDDNAKFSWKQISKAMAMAGESPKIISKLLKNLNSLVKGTKGKVAGYGGKPKWDLFAKESSALPPGFAGFDNMDAEPMGAPKVDLNKLPDFVQRDVVVKIGKTKWLVFRRPSDYTAWAYKYPSAKRKGYEIVSVGKGNFEVWRTTGGGERMPNKTGKQKPEAIGKIK
jgi:hypothetical protein